MVIRSISKIEDTSCLFFSHIYLNTKAMRYSANKSTLPEIKQSFFGYKHWFYNACSVYRVENSDVVWNVTYYPIIPSRLSYILP